MRNLTRVYYTTCWTRQARQARLMILVAAIQIVHLARTSPSPNISDVLYDIVSAVSRAQARTTLRLL